jgi:DNA-binding transcriptional LysR family regulator
MLDVRRLKVLREVAARGSFSAAAEALSFTQSAVSQQVAALERETGATLLERGPRGVRLTDAGRALVEHADAILARIEDAEEELAAIAGLRGGRLRLASFQSAGATVVPRAVAEFHERHPDVELSMIEAEPEDAVAALRTGEIDLALLYDFEGLPRSIQPGIERTHLIDDRYDAVLPKEHKLAGRKSIKLEQLAEDPWICAGTAVGCRQIVERACLEAGFQPKIAFETDETQASQALVAAGVGVTVYPALALTTLHPGLVVVPIAGKVPVRQVWAAKLESAYVSPACEAMLQILRDVAQEFAESAKLAAA